MLGVRIATKLPPALGLAILVYKTARLNVYRLRATMGVMEMIAD